MQRLAALQCEQMAPQPTSFWADGREIPPERLALDCITCKGPNLAPEHPTYIHIGVDSWRCCRLDPGPHETMTLSHRLCASDDKDVSYIRLLRIQESVFIVLRLGCMCSKQPSPIVPNPVPLSREAFLMLRSYRCMDQEERTATVRGFFCCLFLK